MKRTMKNTPRNAKGSRLSADEVTEVFRRFAAASPEPKTELKYTSPFTLLVAVVLSAQATDAGVNKATPALFAQAEKPVTQRELAQVWPTVRFRR